MRWPGFWIALVTAGLLALPLEGLVLGACTAEQPFFVASPTAEPGPAATVTATPAAPAPGTAAPTLAEAPSALAIGFSQEEAVQHLRKLAGEIGSRPAGQSGERAAAAYLAQSFQRYGYQVELQGFSFPWFVDEGSTLVLVRPEDQAFSANTLQFSIPGDLTAPLVPGGFGRPQDLSPREVSGKIALIQRGSPEAPITFQDKVANAASAGAVGVIIYNNQPGNFRGNLGRPGPIPALAIAQADGEALLALLEEKPLTARLTVRSQTEERHSQNVVATKGGTAPTTIVIGAHYDSVEAGPGANDNASGTATILEAARVMAARPYPYTLRFMAFGAEELGLIGSRHYVRSLPPSERERIIAMINLDMVGVGERFRLGGSRELVEAAFSVSEALGVTPSPLPEGRGGGSDHASFLAAGIPSLFLHRQDDPNYHSPEDKAEHVRPEHLSHAGRVLLGLLERLTQE